MRYLFLLIVFSASFWACQPEEACISSATNRFVLEFLPEDNPDITTDDRYFRRIYSPNSDSAFWVDTTRARSSFVLWLNPNSDTTIFIFDDFRPAGRDTLPDDTLVLTYQRRYRLITPDCPLEVSFDQLRVLKSTFDSTRVVNTELIEPSDETDVQVFN